MPLVLGNLSIYLHMHTALALTVIMLSARLLKNLLSIQPDSNPNPQ